MPPKPSNKRGADAPADGEEARGRGGPGSSSAAAAQLAVLRAEERDARAAQRVREATIQRLLADHPELPAAGESSLSPAPSSVNPPPRFLRQLTALELDKFIDVCEAWLIYNLGAKYDEVCTLLGDGRRLVKDVVDALALNGHTPQRTATKTFHIMVWWWQCMRGRALC
jgi:hypothetical protein